MSMGWLFGKLLSVETVGVLAVVYLVLLVYLATKIHLGSKQNAREHAELRTALKSLGGSTDRGFESIDSKLDQILDYLLQTRSDKDD